MKVKRTHKIIATTVAVVAMATGAYLNISKLDVGVPGAINTDITQANLQDTICNPNFRTGTIRPPASYTTALKIKQLANGFAVNGDTNPADYEEDHALALTDGGNPTDENNLWPQPYEPRPGAHEKDQVEVQVHKLICSGAITLAEGQHRLLHWKQYYKPTLGGITPVADEDDL